MKRFNIVIAMLSAVFCLGCQEEPQEPETNPSPRATEKAWPEYLEFGGPQNGPGWAGYWHEVPQTPVDAGNVNSVPLPRCGEMTVITAGDASVVQQPGCPGTTPSYQSLCDRAYQRARDLCKTLCQRTANADPPCINWQLQPHIYEERGCLGGVTPPSTINVPWRRYCDLYEGCVCTFSTE
ncbi:MAG: hypothetical protein P8Y83_11455 [Gammaproteobacteria bacterium]